MEEQKPPPDNGQIAPPPQQVEGAGSVAPLVNLLLRPPVNRITVINQVTYQNIYDAPVQADNRFSVDLKSDEQPWFRWLTAGPGWQPLDCGHVKKASRVMIINREGVGRQVNPTEEERRGSAGKVIQLSLREELAVDVVIPPGQSFHYFPPTSLENLFVRCPGGDVRFHLHVFPE